MGAALRHRLYFVKHRMTLNAGISVLLCSYIDTYSLVFLEMTGEGTNLGASQF